MSQTLITTECTECGSDLPLDNAPLCGEVIPCPTCAVELEVISTDPIRVEPAPEVEEDWGE